MTPSPEMIDLMASVRALQSQLSDCMTQISLLKTTSESEEWIKTKDRMMVLFSDLSIKKKMYDEWSRNW